MRRRLPLLAVLALILLLSLSFVCLSYWPHDLTRSREFRSSNGRSVARRKTLAAKSESPIWRSSFPQAIIIGVKKGGTRALISMLGLHPQIRSAPKEIHFFDRDEEFRKGIDYYISQMPKRKGNQVVVEKTPSYIFNPDVPKRMRATLPLSTKFIVVFREPIERAISDYMQTLSNHVDNSSTVQSLARKVIKTNGCEGGHRQCVDADAYLIQVGQYARSMQEWLVYYNRSQFLFLSGEELISNPVGVLNQVELFLGVKPFFQTNMFYFNKSKGFYCHRLGHKKESSRESDGCLGRTKGRHHIKVDPEVLNMLQDYFTPWNRKLYELIGRNFHWDYKREI